MISTRHLKAWQRFNDDLRANLRRARRYWAMDADRLDAIQEGVIEDTEE